MAATVCGQPTDGNHDGTQHFDFHARQLTLSRES
jgi:hypothetical protein